MRRIDHLATAPEKFAYNDFRFECANIVDREMDRYDSGIGVVFTAEWSDDAGFEYELMSCTKVDENKVSEKFSVPYADTEYSLERKGTDGKKECYYFNSLTPKVFETNLVGKQLKRQDEDQLERIRRLGEWLQTYPLPVIDEQPFKDIAMDYVLSKNAIKLAIENRLEQGKSLDGLKRKIASANPVLDELTIDLGMTRYLYDKPAADDKVTE